MKTELDEKLCKAFPRMFRDRHAPMFLTCMCWGFDHGDGWFNIIWALCSNIQHHIDWQRKQRASALQFNRCLERALKGDKAGLIWYHTHGLEGGPSPWTMKRVEEDIADAKYRKEPDAVPQVLVTQVKEKFGTLRFYYYGGDEKIDGMVRMAESMSALTCEECGAPGKSRSGGWVRTLCDTHAKGREADDEDDDEDDSIEP